MAVSISDAIQLFEKSPTGQGVERIDRNADGVLATDVVRKLHEMHARGRIWFHSFAHSNRAGDSSAARQYIRINRRFEDMLAETSLTLCHEGTHVVREWHLLDEELRSRYLELSYFEELTAGHTLTSGSAKPAIDCHPTDSQIIAEQHRRAREIQSKHLIDSILSINNYDNEYLRALTPAWIRRSKTYWGGLANRWARTGGLYIRHLAEDRNADEADVRIIVEILEHNTSPDRWTPMSEQWGPVENIRRILRRSHDTQLRRTVESLQRAHNNPFGQVY